MDGPTEETLPVAPERRSRTVALLVALLVFAVASAGTFAALWLQAAGDEVTPADVNRFLDAREPAVAERVTEVLELLLNYDATTIDDVSDRLLEISSGGFSEDYEELVGGENLEKALREASASSRGQIVDGPHVYFRDASEAVSITTVSQTVQSRSNPAGTTTDYVFRIILIRADGEWVADDVEILSTDEG